MIRCRLTQLNKIKKERIFLLKRYFKSRSMIPGWNFSRKFALHRKKERERERGRLGGRFEILGFDKSLWLTKLIGKEKGKIKKKKKNRISGVERRVSNVTPWGFCSPMTRHRIIVHLQRCFFHHEVTDWIIGEKKKKRSKSVEKRWQFFLAAKTKAKFPALKIFSPYSLLLFFFYFFSFLHKSFINIDPAFLFIKFSKCFCTTF